jgi:hypothetical protein
VGGQGRLRAQGGPALWVWGAWHCLNRLLPWQNPCRALQRHLQLVPGGGHRGQAAVAQRKLFPAVCAVIRAEKGAIGKAVPCRGRHFPARGCTPAPQTPLALDPTPASAAGVDGQNILLQSYSTWPRNTGRIQLNSQDQLRGAVHQQKTERCGSSGGTGRTGRATSAWAQKTQWSNRQLAHYNRRTSKLGCVSSISQGSGIPEVHSVPSSCGEHQKKPPCRSCR